MKGYTLMAQNTFKRFSYKLIKRVSGYTVATHLVATQFE